ncbi:hypothetical protein GPJ56_009847 [Histomonas meleagridis]|uniref:uncharacterized protein n=1 Tax=Histomonas meleagridis TaxID=135588 RepID=UPI00355AABFD|nr:hypothetical protein GPJ56_009847 [Histomonas meleagridis]KAH0802846.1 hypothetical protein GO595_004353 [Histomonas meleagridis]
MAPAALNASIFSKNNNAIHEVYSLLSSLLPKAQNLQCLIIRSIIPIPFSDFDILSQGIYQCQSLTTLRFNNVPIGDEGFERLARALRRPGIIELQCRRCSLTDASGPVLSALLAYQVFIQSEADWRESLSGAARSPTIHIDILDLRDNEFTYRFINDIYYDVIDLNLKQIDLRGNVGIAPSTVEMLSRYAKNTKILVGLGKDIPPKKANTENIKKLQEENKILRTAIKFTQNNPDSEIVLEDGLSIIGPKAETLIRYLKNIDPLLYKISDAPNQFFKKRNRTMYDVRDEDDI